ncbi:hypothetical protein L1785_11230 [Antribacter sp. KLBMP9083]|uniref:Integral membrane protein n=1 Tax=Antribacter soli TaxID=2910976 RepID=A0AA41QG98_9MICO|nr:hypothetical protein [Antribacter soli]MCF4121554.1 hypothetical protein [Antribacter soli]
MSENTPGGVPRDPADPDEPEKTPPQPAEPDPFAPPSPEPPPSPGTPEPPAYEPPVPGGPTVPPIPGTPAPPPVPGEPVPPEEPPAYGAPPAPAEPPTYGTSGMGSETPSGSPYGMPDPNVPPPGVTPPGGTPYPGAPYPGTPYPGVPAYGGPAGAYGAAAVSPFTVGEAIGFAWNRFKANALPWVLFVLVLLVISSVFSGPSFGDYQRQMDSALEGRPFVQTGMAVTGTLFSIIGWLLSSVVQALGVRAALKEVSGEKPTFASFFSTERLGVVVLAAVIVGVLTFVGLVACILPGLAIIIFATFTYHNVHDKGLPAWEAFTASFRLVAQNFGAVFLLLLACLGLAILGAIPCGLGTFITLPIIMIGIAYGFRRLTGGPVAVA